MRRAWLVILGLCTGLALAEIAVRVLDVPPHPLEPLHLPSYRISDDPVLGYEYRPNLRPEDEPYDALHRGFATNSFGFRDVEMPLHKPAGEIRIVALGDSTTAGNGIPLLENTWPKRLERRFADAGRPEVRLLDLGVGGYHPVQEARLLERRGLAFEPDLALVLICLNDLDARADGGIARRLEQARAGGAGTEGPLAALTRVSRLAFVVTQRARALGSASAPQGPGGAAAAPRNPLADGLAAFARIHDETGLRILVFLLPGLDAPFDRYAHQGLHARMRESAAQSPELPWIDLLDAFRATGLDPRGLSVDGLHPNRAGADVLSQILYRELLQRGLP